MKNSKGSKIYLAAFCFWFCLRLDACRVVRRCPRDNLNCGYNAGFHKAAKLSRTACDTDPHLYPVMSNPDDLMIRSKFDLDRADRLIAMGYPRVAEYIPNMLEWIQDMNWPVAKKLAPFLASLGEPVLPEIRKVLAGDDMIWKYWCIGLLGEMDIRCAETFRQELERLASSPTESEHREELDEQAAWVLEKMSHH